MSRKICIAQSVEELKFILNNIKEEEVICVPLNLPTQLFCIKTTIGTLSLGEFFVPQGGYDVGAGGDADENLALKVSVV